MPDTTPVANNLFYFRLEKYEEVKKALSDLVLAKDGILKDGDAATTSLFDYAEALHAGLDLYNPTNILDSIDISTVCFIPVALINNYLDTKDPAVRDLLTVQLSLVCAATLNFPERNFDAYTFEELMLLQDGDSKIYSDVIFLSTLRELIQGTESDDRTAAIFASLDPIDPEIDTFNDFYWNNALVFSLVMQLVWKNFAWFGSSQQEFLLKNYFYTAIVVGVPIEKWLQMFLSMRLLDFDNLRANNSFLKALEESNERIPTTTNLSSSENLPPVLNRYVSRVYSGDIKTLVQEKFIQDIYKGQVGDKYFSDWLRTTLNTYYSLRNKEYLPR